MGEGDLDGTELSENGDRKEGKLRIVSITLGEVNEFARNPERFKKFFIKQFPKSRDYFSENSDYAFRGTRSFGQNLGLDECSNNILKNGIEFNINDQMRTVGIYLQPGEREDSYERSSHFAFGNVIPEGQTSEVKPKVGDVCVFSVYRYRGEGKYIVDRESRVYSGESSSNKKFVPLDRSIKWNDLLVASIVLQIR